MTGRRALFLCDGGPEVGGGHVLRCLTLAGALGARGWLCDFAAPPFTARLLDRFGEGAGRVPAEDASPEGLLQAAEAAGRYEAVVADHFAMGAAEEARLRAVAPVVAAVDDLADRPHDADLLADCNLGRSPEDYRGLTPPGAVLLLGPAHAPVRPEFGRARAAALRRRAAGGPVRRVLVSLGLTDVGGATARAVQALTPWLGPAALDVVTGAGAPSLPELRMLAEGDGRIALHVDSREVVALMAGADLAIGAGGGSTWERATLGLPTVTLVLAANQRPGAARLAEAGAAVVVEAEERDFGVELADAFSRLAADAGARAELGRRTAALCDGRGAERTAERLCALQGARS